MVVTVITVMTGLVAVPKAAIRLKGTGYKADCWLLQSRGCVGERRVENGGREIFGVGCGI